MDLNSKSFGLYTPEGKNFPEGIWVASLPSEDGMTWTKVVQAYCKESLPDRVKLLPKEAPWNGEVAIPLWGGGGSLWVSADTCEVIECRDCQNPGQPHPKGGFFCGQHSPEEYPIEEKMYQVRVTFNPHYPDTDPKRENFQVTLEHCGTWEKGALPWKYAVELYISLGGVIQQFIPLKEVGEIEWVSVDDPQISRANRS
jgi:hypothetical protein